MDSVTAGGKVPDLGNLKVLTTLDLSNNNLSGTVPESLINLPSIAMLNMSFNHLTGTLPVGQSNTNLSIADFSHNRLNLTTLHLPSVYRLYLSNNMYGGKGELLDLKLRIDNMSAVDLTGNAFKCAYPEGLLTQYMIIWDDCILEPTMFYIMAVLAFVTLVKLAFEYLRTTQSHSAAPTSQENKTTSSVISKLTTVLEFFLLLIPQVDMISDVVFYGQMQSYIRSQRQLECTMLNQKGMFDSSGYVYDALPYPSTSEYNTFQEFVQKIMVYFPEPLYNIQESMSMCLNVNLQGGAPPDCEYNTTGYACVKVLEWARPGQVFGSACAPYSLVRDTFVCTGTPQQF